MRSVFRSGRPNRAARGASLASLAGVLAVLFACSSGSEDGTNPTTGTPGGAGGGGRAAPSAGGAAVAAGTSGSGGTNASGGGSGGRADSEGGAAGHAGGAGAGLGGASHGGGAPGGAGLTGGSPAGGRVGSAGAGGAPSNGGKSGAQGSGGAMAGTGGAAGRAGGAGRAGATGSAGAGGTSGYTPCPATGACKIMPFGDSITQGYNVAGGYRAPLFQRAHAAGHDITFVGSANDYSVATVDGVPFPPNHEGHGGYTIDDEPSHNTKGISPLVAKSMKAYTPAIITLMIGTNDINGNIDASSAPDRLGALLDSIFAADANVLVVLAQIIPTGSDGTNQAVQKYNAAIPAVVSARTSMGRHVVLIDLYSTFTAHSDYRTSLMGDNLHPNQAGYDLLGATWYAAVAPYLP